MGSLRRFFTRYVVPNLPWYGLGFVMLFATNWVIVRIPAIIGEALTILERQGATALAETQSLALELIFLGALVIVVRSLSRILFFNPGRMVEYKVGVDVFGVCAGKFRLTQQLAIENAPVINARCRTLIGLETPGCEMQSRQSRNDR